MSPKPLDYDTPEILEEKVDMPIDLELKAKLDAYVCPHCGELMDDEIKCENPDIINYEFNCFTCGALYTVVFKPTEIKCEYVGDNI